MSSTKNNSTAANHARQVEKATHKYIFDNALKISQRYHTRIYILSDLIAIFVVARNGLKRPETPPWLTSHSERTMFNGKLNSQGGTQMHNTNSLSPKRMTQDQRLQEVAKIMAEALIRLRTPAKKILQSNSDLDSDISLAISAYRSVHTNAENSNKPEAE